jgi:hypothetical protein
VSEFDDLERDELEPGAIGVGMGGSCPVCRAPVDLGQEFCLECGSPIRFTPRQRRQQRGAARGAGVGAAAAAASSPPPGRFAGFPWVPFLVVLALIGGGIAFALVEGGGRNDSASKGKDTSESALPSITNDVPTTDTASSTQTTTVPDCTTTTQPAATDPLTGAPTSTTPGEQIPSIDSPTETQGDATDPFATQGAGVPSTTPGDTTVTVDQNGNLCPATGTSTDPAATTPTVPTTAPTTDTTTDTTATTTTTGSTASGGWPDGKDGWTVIVAGYDTQARAAQTAADLQDDGYTDGGVLFSTDYQSLCPGFYVAFSGVFDTEAKANARLTKLSATGNYGGMYAREIKKTGSRPSSCRSAHQPT